MSALTPAVIAEIELLKRQIAAEKEDNVDARKIIIATAKDRDAARAELAKRDEPVKIKSLVGVVDTTRSVGVMHTCPSCQTAPVYRGNSYCPNCGRKLEWGNR